MLFFGEGQNFEPNSNQQLDDPLRFYDFLTVTPDFVYTQAASYRESSNDEDIKTAFLDLDLPFQVGDKISANFKFGGKFARMSRPANFVSLKTGSTTYATTLSSTTSTRKELVLSVSTLPDAATMACRTF